MKKKFVLIFLGFYLCASILSAQIILRGHYVSGIPMGEMKTKTNLKYIPGLQVDCAAQLNDTKLYIGFGTGIDFFNLNYGSDYIFDQNYYNYGNNSSVVTNMIPIKYGYSSIITKGFLEGIYLLKNEIDNEELNPYVESKLGINWLKAKGYYETTDNGNNTSFDKEFFNYSYLGYFTSIGVGVMYKYIDLQCEISTTPPTVLIFDIDASEGNYKITKTSLFQFNIKLGINLSDI